MIKVKLEVARKILDPIHHKFVEEKGIFDFLEVFILFAPLDGVCGRGVE